MPISKYFGGHGDEVMSSMKKTYKDPDKAKQVFYATANKKKRKGIDTGASVAKKYGAS